MTEQIHGSDLRFPLGGGLNSPPTSPPTSPPLMPTAEVNGPTARLPMSPPTSGQDPSLRPPLSDLPPLTRARTGAEGVDSDLAESGSVRARSAVLVALASAVLAAVLTAGLLVTFAHISLANASKNSQLAGRANLDIQSLLRKAQPSVVSIETGQRSTAGVFGAAGSGVVISADGLVLTNAHVVASATTMQVTFSDGTAMQADLVGSLPADDVALIKLRGAKNLTPAELGSSAEVQVGDDVVAIGNALNLGGPPSVTEGIISAMDRTIESENSTLKNLIQTDAAINPGNSGGPLLNADGQVVGINTAIISDAQNIGFAIAIDSVKPLIKAIKDGRGTVTLDTAFLGVTTQAVGAVSADVQRQFGVVVTDGAYVADVQVGSAAADAGLAVGDVITAIDGEPMSSADDVVTAVRQRNAGDSIAVTVNRAGSTGTVTIVLRSRADSGD